MYDPETTFEPIIAEIAESIAKMRKLEKIDDKLKYSEHLYKLSATFQNFMSSVQMVMDEEFDEEYGEDLDEDDDES